MLDKKILFLTLFLGASGTTVIIPSALPASNEPKVTVEYAKGQLTYCLILVQNASTALDNEAKKEFLAAAIKIYKELLSLEKEHPHLVDEHMSNDIKALYDSIDVLKD